MTYQNASEFHEEPISGQIEVICASLTPQKWFKDETMCKGILENFHLLECSSLLLGNHYLKWPTYPAAEI